MGNALVLGLGVSGRAAAMLLLAKGFKVTGVDSNKNALLSDQLKSLKEKGLTAQHDADPLNILEFDQVVISPGIPQNHPLYLAAKQANIEIVGELELAFRYLNQKAIGITGTNGKTTVTLLVEHVLKNSGFKAKAVGNVGHPLTTYCFNSDPEEILVVELSSYQLETLYSASFAAGVILNITPDHLDRYAGMKEYAEAKCRLQECMRGPLFVHEDTVLEFGFLLNRPYKTYGHHQGSYFRTDKEKVFLEESIEYILPVRYRGMGIHESENTLAAWALCKQVGVTKEQFLSAIETFKKPSHRIEFVKEIEGISYYDDSKGTNIDAVIQAVSAMKGPVVLIAGGVDKGASYLPWEKTFRGKVKSIIVIGQAAEKICLELREFFKVEKVDTLSTAVDLAHMNANSGDCVLLSPGCSSFDMFRDYAHRGEEFKRCVHHLEERRIKE